MHAHFVAPGERIHWLLGQQVDEAEDSSSSGVHPVFTEMEELHGNTWREVARWVKFEENVEEGGNRWSKPYVGTVSLHSLFELRSCIQNGTVVLEMEAEDLPQIIGMFMFICWSGREVIVL